MKRLLLLAVSGIFVTSAAHAQISPPAPGVDMPQAYYDQIADNPNAFQFKNAWIQKAQRAKAARQAYFARPENRGMTLDNVPSYKRPQLVTAGTVSVPVIMVKYADTPADPFPISDMQNKLFDGPDSQTMTGMYSEMSYGNVMLTGTVFGWVQLANNGTFYEDGCQALCQPGTGLAALFSEAITAVDPTTDFGQFDNDGPDGVPNSGDDDGFVDFIAFVHPETGAECDMGPNIWSHRFVVQGWDDVSAPINTSDARTGGGVIRIQDYTIQPALGLVTGCGAGGINEIGVFAHEFGHAFGLPDLYDTNGGGQGIGEHGLMGSGNWRVPANPTHMSAWSKIELGWLSSTRVEGPAQLYSIAQSELNPVAYQLNIMEEKFNRKTFQAISGTASLHCGLPTGAANNRNWVSSAGYGNNWDEAIRHDFTYSGGAVNLQYDAAWDTEAGYDYGYVKIKVNGTETTLASYDGNGALNNVTHNITSLLTGQSSYQVIFEFTSDFALSDEDGISGFDSNGPFVLDNVSVSGGGENYSSDFEQYEDGWYYDFTENPNKEYFLVENRNKTGAMFDQNIYANGLLIWQVEQNLAGDNTSGSESSANLRPAALEMRSGDGLSELLLAIDRGDAGDYFPGSTNNTSFNNGSLPPSTSHNGFQTNVSVTGISAPSQTMSATMTAGYFAPAPTTMTPVMAAADEVIAVEITGAQMAWGSSFMLRDAGQTDFPASNVVWVGKAKITGDLDLTGLASGTYDWVVRGPDGQEAIVADGFTVTPSVPVFIQAFDVAASDDGMILSWDLFADEEISGFKILRREVGDQIDRWINSEGLLAPSARSYIDNTVEAGKRYEFTLVVILPDGSELTSPRVPGPSAGVALTLFQNHPNPFNPSTVIRFALPEQGRAVMRVFDPAGRRVRTLVDDVLPQGANDVVWDGRNDNGDPVATGVYFYQLSVGKSLLTKKLLLLK